MSDKGTMGEKGKKGRGRAAMTMWEIGKPRDMGEGNRQNELALRKRW